MSLRSLEAERIDLGGICRDRTPRSTASFDRIHSSMERPPCVVEDILVNLTQNINRQQSRLMQILAEQSNKPIRVISTHCVRRHAGPSQTYYSWRYE